MRIITGKLKGRRFHIPKNQDVRPTTDRIKESIFNKIEAYKYIEGSRVLDLFAGSGSLGFEAVSRGADSVLAVELNPENTELIRNTAIKFGIQNQITAQIGDALSFTAGKGQAFDFIFCDPPYFYESTDQIVEQILKHDWLADNGWLILEHDKYHNYKKHPHCFFSKAYGRSTVSMFRKTPGSD